MYITTAGVLEQANAISFEIAGALISLVSVSEYANATDTSDAEIIKFQSGSIIKFITEAGYENNNTNNQEQKEFEKRKRRILIDDSEIVAIVQLTLQHFTL